MTESNITREHEGKHGVLTLAGSHLDVTIVTMWARGFDARVDKESYDRFFLFADGWQFTPDPDPLPIEVGWYAQNSGGIRLFFLTGSGDWFVHTGKAATYMASLSVARFHTIDPLVRVRFGDES